MSFKEITTVEPCYLISSLTAKLHWSRDSDPGIVVNKSMAPDRWGGTGLCSQHGRSKPKEADDTFEASLVCTLSSAGQDYIARLAQTSKQTDQSVEQGELQRKTQICKDKFAFICLVLLLVYLLKQGLTIVHTGLELITGPRLACD